MTFPRHFSELKRFFLYSFTIFFAAAISGYAAAYIYPELVSEVFNQLMEKFRPFEHASSLDVFSFIFLNNTLIDLAAILAFFFFGLVPIYFLASNGFLIGIVVGSFIEAQGARDVFASIAPHGIIEIPAFIISTAYGMWLGTKFFKKIFKKEPFKKFFFIALRIFFLVILPLNFIAALIEVYVTPLVYAVFSH